MSCRRNRSPNRYDPFETFHLPTSLHPSTPLRPLSYTRGSVLLPLRAGLAQHTLFYIALPPQIPPSWRLLVSITTTTSSSTLSPSVRQLAVAPTYFSLALFEVEACL